MKIQISNLELAVIFYIIILFIFDFTYLGFITSVAYGFFNILKALDKRRKK